MNADLNDKLFSSESVSNELLSDTNMGHKNSSPENVSNVGQCTNSSPLTPPAARLQADCQEQPGQPGPAEASSPPTGQSYQPGNTDLEKDILKDFLAKI